MNKNEIYPIGIGTWKIDYENIDNDIPGLNYQIENGQNYWALSMLYNNGEVVRKLKPIISSLDRNKIFITANLEPTIECISDVEKQLDEYLNILEIKNVDCLQLHKPSFSNIPLIEVYREIKRLVYIGKVRYIGISNSRFEELIELDKEVKIDFFEGVYNLECKIYEDNGVIEYCKNNNIIFNCYQPIRRNRTSKRNYPILVELANKYNKTQNQILINWIVKEKGLNPIIKSTHIERIKENLDAISFEMDKEDYDKLNKFRSEEFDNIKIDWANTGDGVSIDQLANQFE